MPNALRWLQGIVFDPATLNTLSNFLAAGYMGLLPGYN